MKLLRAEFRNFRLLRELELEFSVDPKRPLTVIRAANETGKTTILTALQWALYGDSALPGKGVEYRLHPIDWDPDTTPLVNVSVTVDFEVTSSREGYGGTVRETRRRYRLVRATNERLAGNSWTRVPSNVKLYTLTDRGSDLIEAPESIIQEVLPPDLREVFFTDGDRALSFIEADVALSTKRDRVQRAIRSLLGLNTIEEALKHVQLAGAAANRRAKKLDGGSELSDTANRLEEIDNAILSHQTELADAEEQFTNFDESLADIDKKIAAALSRGDKEKLQRELESAKSECKKLDARIEAAIKEHANLFRSESLARGLLGPVLAPAFTLLEELRDRGKIPNTTIPVLEDRLRALSCICGESLDPASAVGSGRRRHIETLIDNSRRADEIQEIVTDLYFGSRSFSTATDRSEPEWLADYTRVVKSRDGLDDLREEAGRRLRGIELQIDGLPDADIQGLRDTKRQYQQQRDRFLAKKTQLATALVNLRREQAELSAKRERLLREQSKGARVLAELDVVSDIQSVLQRSYDRITQEELQKVSDRMNQLFLEMIGSDPEQGATIHRAEISQQYDIIVFGPGGRTLNPDRDLNGASRRALTLAFILALTQVSEVEAPNVIDTPLGMMSGYVKRSVLEHAIRESAQLILLLTQSEILGCESLLDVRAGLVITLTNPTHYPRILISDPRVRELRILRCECNHRTTCVLCARREDAGESDPRREGSYPGRSGNV
ncbi:MAG: AAA family ATPase [Nannocystaceae bacterium]